MHERVLFFVREVLVHTEQASAAVGNSGWPAQRGGVVRGKNCGRFRMDVRFVHNSLEGVPDGYGNSEMVQQH